MDTTAFTLSSVNFQYNKSPVLNSISLTIEKGKFTSICGKNGSGKSTLLKLLAGILKQQSGDIFLYDKKISEYKSRSLYKIMSYVPQVHTIEIPLTVSEIILTGRHPYQNLIEQDKTLDFTLLDTTLNATGLTKYKNSLFNNLSGGEKQKVLIARALCQSDDIILLDEPTSSLDIGNKIEIMEILHELSRNGTTVITVSHDINEVNNYADTVIFIVDNQAVTGTKETLMNEKYLGTVYNANIQSVEYNGKKLFYY